MTLLAPDHRSCYHSPVPQDDPYPRAAQSGDGRFESTHWSVVLAAAETQSPEATAALETLCNSYWYPLYAYLRRRGHAVDDAKDITQEFFARRVVNRQIFGGVSPGAGRFRTWLLNSLQNLVCNEWDRRQAQKRGGGQEHVSLDFVNAEDRYLADPQLDTPPEVLYDRDWAATLLDSALAELRASYEREGKAELFEAMKRFLQPTLPSYAEVALQLGRSEAAIKMAVSRFRHEYGDLIRKQIKRTVSSAEEERAEFEHLKAVLRT